MTSQTQGGIARRGLADIDILVLAGGLGTRIRPVLGDKPKLLAPIGDRTYLAHLLDWLAGFGAQRILFGLGYGADTICAELARHAHRGLAIETSIEPKPLGTAGAIAFSRNRLRSDPVMVLNGDSFVEADLDEFVASFTAHGPLGAILCTEVEDSGRYGGVSLDGDGNIQRF